MPSPRAVTASASTPTPAIDLAIDASIDRAVESLQRALEAHDGEVWRDYVSADGSGGSTEWVTGFIAAHIGRVPQARSLAARGVAGLLRRARRSGGWGYHEQMLADCDSTAWAVIAASRSGVALPEEVTARALHFIVAHQEDQSGGLTTYGAIGRQLMGEIASREGWFRAQVCVSAASLIAMVTTGHGRDDTARRTAEYLRGQQGDDALWMPYWWHGFTYGTYHVALALLEADALTQPEATRIARAVAAQQRPDGGWAGQDPDDSTGFATALGLLTVLALDPDALSEPALTRAVRRLLAEQRDDGGFTPSAELLVPGGVTDEILTMLDNGPFTTAAIVHALDEARSRRRAREAPWTPASAHLRAVP